MGSKLKYYKLQLDCIDGAIEYIDIIKEINKTNYMMNEVITEQQNHLEKFKEDLL